MYKHYREIRDAVDITMEEEYSEEVLASEGERLGILVTRPIYSKSTGKKVGSTSIPTTLDALTGMVQSTLRHIQAYLENVEGLRGDIKDIEALIEDVQNVVESARREGGVKSDLTQQE